MPPFAALCVNDSNNAKFTCGKCQKNTLAKQFLVTDGAGVAHGGSPPLSAGSDEPWQQGPDRGTRKGPQ